jgi:site-specific recombinase XerC
VIETYLRPRLGDRRLTDVTAPASQALIEDMVATGASPSTIRNTIIPLRVVYRRAMRDGEVAANPTEHLGVPTSQTRREGIADPREAAALIALVPSGDRALRATSFYGRLRRGELMGLEWATDCASFRARFDDVFVPGAADALLALVDDPPPSRRPAPGCNLPDPGVSETPVEGSDRQDGQSCRVLQA